MVVQIHVGDGIDESDVSHGSKTAVLGWRKPFR